LYRGSDGVRSRLFIRTSIKLSNEPSDHRYTTATFLLDTGCCPHLNISIELKQLLKDRIKKNDGREFYIPTLIDDLEHQCIVKSDLPGQPKSANVMGLPMLFAPGIAFRKGRFFSFPMDDEDVVYDVATFGEFDYL
jgi:hypothetical protein